MMIERETLEWTQTWWQQAERDDLPRVLTIGDSILCGYRERVQQKLAGQVYVDQFATSKFAADPFFEKELALYAEAYPYACIHFNHGLHGLTFPPERYAECYERTLRYLLSLCPRVILALSPPITVPGRQDTLDPLNEVVVRRNEIVRGLAERYQLPLNDLYTPMLGHPEYRSGDGYHYLDAGREAQAALVAGKIAETINAQ